MHWDALDLTSNPAHTAPPLVISALRACSEPPVCAGRPIRCWGTPGNARVGGFFFLLGPSPAANSMSQKGKEDRVGGKARKKETRVLANQLEQQKEV